MYLENEKSVLDGPTRSGASGPHYLETETPRPHRSKTPIPPMQM
jgi:hypothetical protein